MNNLFVYVSWQWKDFKRLADLEGGNGGCTPFQILKIKESNKTKQKIEDNPLEKEEESSFYVYTRWYVYRQTFFYPPLKNFWIRAFNVPLILHWRRDVWKKNSSTR